MADRKAFVLYLILTVIIWQLALSLTNIAKMKTGYENILFKFVPTVNTGAAFGVFENFSLILGIFGLIILIFSIIYAFFNLKFEQKAKILFLSGFCAGVLGNVYQRLVFGHVFDFIKINLFNFPIFNFFDILICLNAFLLAVIFFKEEKNEN